MFCFTVLYQCCVLSTGAERQWAMAPMLLLCWIAVPGNRDEGLLGFQPPGRTQVGPKGGLVLANKLVWGCWCAEPSR